MQKSLSDTFKDRLPRSLYDLASKCPFPLYVVGGYVRDVIAGFETARADIDICAPTASDEFIAVAKGLGAKIKSVYRNTGTVKLILDGAEYEFACFRSDEYVRGVHTPVKTFFTDDIRLDARRRDFKCNAVYYDLKDGRLSDPLGGIADIKAKRLTTVADADKVFGEDGLRLMRLCRLAAQTGFEPSSDCMEGAKRNAALIDDVSAERTYIELDAILHADSKYGVKLAQYRGLLLLSETGVLARILPELALGKGMPQPEKFHRYDVLEHSLRTVMYADDGVRLAALLHDIGKPYCMTERGNYHGHEAESARIAKEVLARIKAPQKLAEEVVRLAQLHMYDMRCDARESKIRRLIVRNADIFEKLLMLKQADYSACLDDEGEAPCVKKWRKIYSEMLEEGVPLSLKQLDVRGNELIFAGIVPRDVGKILERLLEECAQNAVENRKDKLLKRAVSIAAEMNGLNSRDERRR